MKRAERFEDLIAWQKARSLTVLYISRRGRRDLQRTLGFRYNFNERLYQSWRILQKVSREIVLPNFINFFLWRKRHVLKFAHTCMLLLMLGI